MTHEDRVTLSRIRLRTPPLREGWLVILDGVTLGRVVGGPGSWRALGVEVERPSRELAVLDLVRR